MIRFTKEAVAMLGRVYAEAPDGSAGLRIEVTRGCHGLAYDMHFVAGLEGDDEIVRAGKVPIVLSPTDGFLLVGTIVDFENGEHGGGFTFANPNTHSGACGGCAVATSCGPGGTP
jgi:iron-sulfur cluster assembly protein